MTFNNNNSQGIIFILLGMAFFSIQDALIKFIFEDIALFMVWAYATSANVVSHLLK